MVAYIDNFASMMIVAIGSAGPFLLVRLPRRTAAAAAIRRDLTVRSAQADWFKPSNSGLPAVSSRPLVFLVWRLIITFG
jgi:hypothetical protein